MKDLSPKSWVSIHPLSDSIESHVITFVIAALSVEEDASIGNIFSIGRCQCKTRSSFILLVDIGTGLTAVLAIKKRACLFQVEAPLLLLQSVCKSWD